MSRINKSTFFGGLLVLYPIAFGQEQPLSIQGTFTTGYYSTFARGQENEKLSFVPFGARFDIDGYYKTPDFLNFSAQPEFNAGPQASDAGFLGGNGGRFQVTLLRRLIPITFHYANVQVEDVFFGSLTQISGYTLKNRNKDLGLTLQLISKRLPATIVDWGVSSVDSQSSIAEVSDYVSQGNHFNLDSKYERWGWIFEGFAHHQEQQSNLLAPVNGGTTFGSLNQTVKQYQASARRSFFQDWEWSTDGGSESTNSLLFALPVDLSTRYVNTNLQMFQKRRFRTSFRASYSSNLASQLLEQAIGSVAGAGSIVPDPTALLPYSHGLSTFNLTGNTTATLAHGFGIYAAVERNQLFSSSLGAPLDANYFTVSGGVTYARTMAWGSFSGDYGREYGAGSVIGQGGTIQGQTWRATMQKGGSHGPHIDASVRGSEQNVRSAQPLSNDSISFEVSVAGRLVRDINGQIGGGWEWGSIVNSANEFKTNGYTARVGIEHPRFQVSAMMNDNVSNSLPFYNQALGGLGVEGALLLPFYTIPSDYRSSNVTVHAFPLRKVEISALWTHSRQNVAGVLGNDFQFLNVFVTYHFRKIKFEAGLIRSNQTFAFYPYTVRQRFYVRVLRNTKLI